MGARTDVCVARCRARLRATSASCTRALAAATSGFGNQGAAAFFEPFNFQLCLLRLVARSLHLGLSGSLFIEEALQGVGFDGGLLLVEARPRQTILDVCEFRRAAA